MLEVLDVAIGVIFVFTLVALICSAIREVIEARLKTRAAYLEQGIRELLHDPRGTGLARSLYRHPLVYSLFAADYRPTPRLGASGDGDSLRAGAAMTRRPAILAAGGNLPSYIPARNFALALLDMAARGPETDALTSGATAAEVTVDTIRANVASLGNPPVQRALLTALDAAEGSLDRTRENVERWFDSGMDRVSGWYKRSTQWILFTIGLVIAVGLNVDTIAIAEYLYRNDAARAAIVERARVVTGDTAYLERSYAQAMSDLQSLDLPIGWSHVAFGMPWRMREERRVVDGRPRTVMVKNGFWDSIVAPLAGWLCTALAAMLGAPFWFDLLNKVMVIRSTVKPAEKSPEEGSEDRQPRGAKEKRRAREEEPEEIPQPVRRREKARVLATAPIVERGDGAEHEELDGCGVVAEGGIATRDEDLPAATGGVASS